MVLVDQVPITTTALGPRDRFVRRGADSTCGKHLGEDLRAPGSARGHTSVHLLTGVFVPRRLDLSPRSANAGRAEGRRGRSHHDRDVDW